MAEVLDIKKTISIIHNAPREIILKFKKELEEKKICENSFYEFFKRAYQEIEPENELVDNWHIKFICDILQKETERIVRKDKKSKDLIITISPRSLKSFIVSVIWNAWAWAKYPHLKFISASYSEALSIDLAMKTRRILESDWYKENWGEKFKKDQNTKSRFDSTSGGHRIATSVGGTVTGLGADIIIGDDLQNPKLAYSEVAREQANDFWQKTMFSRLNKLDVGLRVIIQQRLHEDDLVGRLLTSGKNYRLINIPAELTDETSEEVREFYRENLFFPERLSKEVLDNARLPNSLGERDYFAQYLQKPTPDKGSILQVDWFKKFRETELPQNIKRDFWTDGAYGKENSDNSATICYSVHEGNLYIWNVWACNLEFPDFIKQYKNFLLKNKYSISSRCRFEPKATGISLVQQLKQELLEGRKLNIIEDVPPNDSKETRVRGISSIVESGRVFLLENSEWIDSFLHECKMFPNGKHDDQVDCLEASIRNGLGKKSFGVKSNLIFNEI